MFVNPKHEYSMNFDYINNASYNQFNDTTLLYVFHKIDIKWEIDVCNLTKRKKTKWHLSIWVTFVTKQKLERLLLKISLPDMTMKMTAMIYNTCFNCFKYQVLSCSELGHCSYHPEPAKFNNSLETHMSSAIGVYGCCNQQTLRFDPLEQNSVRTSVLFCF